MMKPFKRVLVSAGILTVLIAAAGWFFSGQIIKFEKKTLAEDKERREVKPYADYALSKPEEVVIPAAGISIHGFYFSENADKCAVIISHGHTGTRYGAFRYADIFAGRCAMLMPDARYHGKSGGDAGTYGFYEKKDMVALFKWLQKKTGLSAEHIGLLGESMGAAISLEAAALDIEPAFVIAESPYAELITRIEEGAEQLYGSYLSWLVPVAIAFAELRTGADFSKVSPAAAAAKIGSPVLLIHSEADKHTFAYHSEKIYKAVKHDRKELHILDWGATHTRSKLIKPGEFNSIVKNFINRYASDFWGER